MTTLDIVLPALATGIVVLLFYGPVRRSRSWHAMVTPLASIIGSGFLVVVPVLGHALGADSIWAILAIVVFAYGVGEALRFNIVHLEPLLASTPDDCRNAHDRAPVLPRIELLASLALALAYFVSVTFYLRLLSAFVLRGLGWHEAWTANALTTALLVLIGAVGKRRGLSALERLEQYSVSIKLAIIGALLLGWAVLAGREIGHQGGVLLEPAKAHGWEAARIIAGTFLIVQGFETSRYLGAKYSARRRVRTMRAAQLVSAAIYVAFVGLSLPSLRLLPDQLDETAIIPVARHVALVLPSMVILAATMSQFSAAVADTVGAGGLLSQCIARHHLLSARDGYVVVAVVGIVLVWSTDVFAIIALASRAFALYYTLQAVGAVVTANQVLTGRKRWFATVSFSAIAIVLTFIVVFAIPAG